MATAGKWNYQTKKYDEYQLPEKALRYSDDMDVECQCANCGTKMAFGDGYTSLEIHNAIGFGYVVCEKCYEEEFKRKHEKKDEQ